MKLTFTGIKFKKIMAILLLIVISIIGFLCSVPLFYGVDLYFGMVAIFIILRMFGQKTAIVSTVITSVIIYFLRGNFFEVILYTTEIVLVSFFILKRKNLLLVDGLYWLGIGGPIVFSFYNVYLELNAISSLVIAITFLINGVLNVLLANVIIYTLPIERWLGLRKYNKLFYLRHLLFHIFVGLVLVPSLFLTIQNGWKKFNEVEENIKEQVSVVAYNVKRDFHHYQESHVKALQALSDSIVKDGTAQIHEKVKIIENANPDFDTILVIDQKGKILAGDIQGSSDKITKSQLVERLIREGNQTYSGFITSIDDYQTDSPFIWIGRNLKINQEIGGQVNGAINVNQISSMIHDNLLSHGMEGLLLNGNHQVLASSSLNQGELKYYQQFNHPNGTIIQHDYEISQWIPENTFSELEKWGDSYYFLETEASNTPNWKVLVKLKAKRYVGDLYNSYLYYLLLLVILIFGSFLAAKILSSMILKPIEELAEITNRIPEKLEKRETIVCPSTSLIEMQELLSNFGGMTNKIKELFEKIRVKEEHLKFLAEHDDLTKLLNFNCFREVITKELFLSKSNGTKAGIFFIDLDRFKYINDTYGHHAGDQVLKLVSSRILDQFGDQMVACRQGGDEFLLFHPNTSRDELYTTGERIVRVLGEEFDLDGNTEYITASVGICVYPDHGNTIDELVKSADQAMYQAKRSGKNQFKFYNEVLKTQH